MTPTSNPIYAKKVVCGMDRGAIRIGLRFLARSCETCVFG